MGNQLTEKQAGKEPTSRRIFLRRGLLLAVATVLWNVLEGIIAVAAGVAAGSVALLGFGIDSFFETASAVVVGWRLRDEWRGGSPERAERLEQRTARIAGGLLLLLAVYIAVDAGRRLLGYAAPAEPSRLGLGLTAASLVVMPLLGWAKLRTARFLQSSALRADAFETLACVWLSVTTFTGLLLNVLFGWAWADPAGALLLIPLIVREGWEALRGEMCGEDNRKRTAS